MRACCPNCGSERHYNVPATEDCRRHIRADAYERGRADERADVVACLGDFARITGGPVPIATIERGGHVGTAKKGKP